MIGTRWRCHVQTCENINRRSSHKFPTDLERREHWIRAVKQGVNQAGFEYVPFRGLKRTRRACNKHFTPDQFLQNEEDGGRIKLHRWAVPKLFRGPDGTTITVESNYIPPVPAPVLEKPPLKIQRKVFPDRIDRSCKAVQCASQDPLPTAKPIPPKLSECCRLCFSKDLLEPICYGMMARDELLDKIYLCTGVLIVARPKESVYICTPCVNQIKGFFTYRQQICSNNRAVQQHLSKLNGPEKPPIASNSRKGPVTPVQMESTSAGPSEDINMLNCLDTTPIPRAVPAPLPKQVSNPIVPIKGPVTSKQKESTSAGPSEDVSILNCQDTTLMPRAVPTPMPKQKSTSAGPSEDISILNYQDTTPMPRAVPSPMPKQISNPIVPSKKIIFPPYIPKKRKLDEDPQPPVLPESEEFIIDAPPKTEPFDDPLELRELPVINVSDDDSSSTDSCGSGIDAESDPSLPRPEASSAGKEDEQEAWKCWHCSKSFPFKFECAKHALLDHRNSVLTIRTRLMLDELNTNMLEMMAAKSKSTKRLKIVPIVLPGQPSSGGGK